MLTEWVSGLVALIPGAIVMAIVVICLQWAFDERDRIRIHLRGVWRFFRLAWRKSGVIWMVFSYGKDEFVGLVHFDGDQSYRYLDTKDLGKFVKFVTRPHVTQSDAAKRVRRLAKLAVCFGTTNHHSVALLPR